MPNPPARRPLSRFGMRVTAGVFAACVSIMAMGDNPSQFGAATPPSTSSNAVWTAMAVVVVSCIGLFIVQLSQRTLRWAVLAFYTWAIARALAYWPSYNASAIYIITCTLLWHVYRCVRQDLPPTREWPWSHHPIEA